MQKNGGEVNPQDLQNKINPLGGGLSGLGGLGGLGGLSGLRNLGSNTTSPNTSATNQNPFGNMMGNPFLPMGLGFGNNQGMNFPNNQQNPLFSNPLLGGFQNNQNSAPLSSISNGGVNAFQSMLQTMQNAQLKRADETKYENQIK